MDVNYEWTFFHSPEYRRSPYFDATVRDGAQGFDLYNHMLLPMFYSQLEYREDYWQNVERAGLWDVSVDTLEPFRRQGYAGLCVAYVIDQMNRERRRPVWGAVESNEASLRLASKLGFRPVDRIIVFERPG